MTDNARSQLATERLQRAQEVQGLGGEGDRLIWYLAMWREILIDSALVVLFDSKEQLGNLYMGFALNLALEKLDRGEPLSADDVRSHIPADPADLRQVVDSLILIAADDRVVERERVLARALEWRERIWAVRNTQAILAETNQLVAHIRKNAEEAQSLAESAASAAGVLGERAFSKYFDQYANRERGAATRYRFATIAAIGATFVFGLFSPLLPTGWSASNVTELGPAEIIYRIALITALGALSVYLGRQSGVHRRNATWAEALEVQIDTFPAFIGRVDAA